MSTTPLGPTGTATGLLAPFPDPPPRHPDEMSSHRHLDRPGASYLLDWHFGHPDTTLIAAELYIAPEPGAGTKGQRAPDLLIAFDVDPDAYHRSNAYIVSEQASPRLRARSRLPFHGHVDVRDKPADYAALGIPEYWRFDETGAYHGERLAGDRLVGDHYEPIGITELPDGSLEGYSEVLDLYLRWEDGWLSWHDPETGRAIMNLAEMQRIAEEERQGPPGGGTTRGDRAAGPIGRGTTRRGRGTTRGDGAAGPIGRGTHRGGTHPGTRGATTPTQILNTPVPSTCAEAAHLDLGRASPGRVRCRQRSRSPAHNRNHPNPRQDPRHVGRSR